MLLIKENPTHSLVLLQLEVHTICQFDALPLLRRVNPIFY